MSGRRGYTDTRSVLFDEEATFDLRPWVKDAIRLRMLEWSYQRIADELGRPYRQVYKALNPSRVRTWDRESDRRNRTAQTRADLVRRRRLAPRCSRCQRKMSKPPKAQPPLCRKCRAKGPWQAAGLAERNERIMARLEETGSPYQVAEEFGLSWGHVYTIAREQRREQDGEGRRAAA